MVKPLYKFLKKTGRKLVDMLKKDLNGSWKVTHIPHGQSIEKMLDNNFIPEGWLTADVPELIHGTLQRLGYINKYYYGKDFEKDKWIEEVDWVYYRQFYLDNEYNQDEVILQFSGLDTFCDIFLNGEKIGKGDNMFSSIFLDVTDKLLYGKRNVIIIRFYSPVKHVEDKDMSELYSPHPPERLWVRKAQMNYSWDFCGRSVSTGIWKRVAIIARDHNYINNYYLYTEEISKKRALVGLELDLNTEIDSKNNDKYQIEVELNAAGKQVYHYQDSIMNCCNLQIEIKNPRLWWPHPYGEPFLYQFDLKLLKDDKVVDSRVQKYGLRSIEIIQEDQEDGRSYVFAVNGKRIFVRGANWVPLHVIYTSIEQSSYQEMLEYATEDNLSMLRIWGGGIYEPEKFFEICDEKGIMVWQDFMFACGIYPQEDQFLENVLREAEEVIKKYRNYTSLVLWCGDNENDISCSWAAKPYHFFEDKINRGVLKEACQKYDPYRLYVPSSPYSPFEFYKGGENPKSPFQGDMHTYITDLNPDSKTYYKRIKYYRPRFMSEFGFMSLPEKDSYYRYNFKKESLKQFDIIKERFPDVEEYIENASSHQDMIYYTQVYNSYAFKYWIEYFRSLKWICAGTLYWKFNDPLADTHPTRLYPGLCAVMDFYQKPKMTYYYTKRAFADVILAFVEKGDKVNIYGCSEKDYTIRGQLIVEHRSFDGKVIKQEELECSIKENSSDLLYTINPVQSGIGNKYNEYLKVQFRNKNIQLENRYFFVDIGEFYRLNFPQTSLEKLELNVVDNIVYIYLKTDGYARNVRLNITDCKAHYDDNYFDLEGGREKQIKIKIDNMSELENKVLYIEGVNLTRKVFPLVNIKDL